MPYAPNNNLYLAHYGIKGMKWGVRRYQNADGSLNDRGRKQVSKRYKKEMIKAERAAGKRRTSMQVEAYNKMANHMNSGGIDKFNASQRKKYGEKYADRDGYIDDYEKLCDKLVENNFKKIASDFYHNNKNYQKAKSMVDEYNMTEWDELARTNENAMAEIKRSIEKNR